MPTTLSIATSSQFTNNPTTTPAVNPVITLNSTVLTPTNPGNDTSGFQYILIDPSKPITSPGAILWNRLHPIRVGTGGGWWSQMSTTYDEMLRAVYTVANPFNVFVIAASFGLDRNMGPPSSFLQHLASLGAGAQLQAWLNGAMYGYGGSGGGPWVSTPANYIIVGSVGQAFGGASGEIFQKSSSFTAPLSTTLTVQLP